MKNKLISWLLAVVFIVAALPVSALPVFADESATFTITNSSINNGVITITYTANKDQYLYYYISTTQIANDSGVSLDTVEQAIKATNGTSLSITFGSTATVYFYYCNSATTTNKSIKRNDMTELVIKPTTTDKTAPSLSKFVAFRETYTNTTVKIRFTADEDGTFYYGTASNFAASSSSSRTFTKGDNIIYISLSSNLKAFYYKTYDGTNTSDTKNVAIFSFGITGYEWASASSVKFTYTCSGGGTLYYKLSTNKTKTLSNFMSVSSATSGSFTISGVTDNNETQYLNYQYVPSEYASCDQTSYTVDPYSVQTAPEVTGMYITNRTSSAATAVFISDIAGKIYYKVATSTPAKSAMTSGMTIAAGTNQFDISGLTTSSTRLYYYTADETGTVTSSIYSVTIPSYSSGDTTAPVLSNSSIKKSTSNSKVTATLTFSSSEDGIIYYTFSYKEASGDTIVTAFPQSYSSISSGSNSVSATINVSSVYCVYVSYYAVDAAGNKSNTYSINTLGEVSGEPNITNVYVLHPTAKGGNVYFTSDRAGYFYYSIDNTTSFINVKMDTGSNNFYITLADGNSHEFYYYASSKDSADVPANVANVTIPEYSTTAVSIVKIKSVSQSPGTNTYVNGDAGVTLTISASSDVSDTLVFEYDFGDGKWTTSNSKKFTESTTIAAGGIRARVIDDTNSSNWAVYPSEYIISNIDNGKPTINSVDRTPTDTTKATDSVKITVNAIDTASGTGGKASGIYGYSFDGGVTYQTSNVKEYKSNTTIAINKICVKDSVGNVSYYSNSITINNVDSTAPSINNITTSRSTVDVGTIKFISSEAGIFHYEIVMNYAIQDSSKEYLVSNESVLVEGSNTFTISGLKAYGEGQIALAFYLEDSAGNTSLLYTAFIPAYGEEDKKAPEIVSVTLNTTSPTNQPVSVVVEAKDDVDLADKAYSFDGGKTWQQSNEYAYKENTVITAGTIVVRDAAENETKYNKELKITNIDTTLPTMSVSVTASAGNVIIRVTASDDVSLQSAAYSFDGGITWQAASTKTYSKSTTIASEMIQVRDTAGNIRKYATVITQGQMDALLGDEWSNPYTDVKTTDWYYSYVQTVVEAGLFQGVSSTSFSPNLNMTRAMFVTVLGRLEGINAGDYTTNKYSDVSAGQWYTGYVAWATQNGIVNGYDNGKFGINDNITREQMCTMIVRYLDYLELTSDLNVMNITFADKAQISDWAERSVSICQQLGLVVGSDNKFRPKDGSTRAEVATVFTRIINAFEY